MLVTVRRCKTNQEEGETKDVRFVKNGVARAIRTLRAFTNPAPAERVVPLSAQMIGVQFTAAAQVSSIESAVGLGSWLRLYRWNARRSPLSFARKVADRRRPSSRLFSLDRQSGSLSYRLEDLACQDRKH